MSHRLLRLALIAPCLGLLALAGCASDPPRPQAPAAAPETPEPVEPALPPGSLSRKRVDAVLKEGPPWLLSRVQVEEVLRKGAFVGWRVVSLPASWEGSGVRTGDVVTRVNGLGLEKPDDFFAVWTNIAQAKEVRLAIERDGKPEELAMPIVGEPGADTKAALEREMPEPQQQAVPVGPNKPRETVIIRGSAEDPLDAVDAAR